MTGVQTCALPISARARQFYEGLGGVYVRAQAITIGSATLEEVSYGWPSLHALTVP